MSEKPVYITTPIYYVNDKPHIGHVYTTTVADVAARHWRQRGRRVFFLTGTDEHAAKVADSARERGLTPQEWADQNAIAFKNAFAELKLSNDDFIRTSEARHTDRVIRYVKELMDSGDVYLGEYEGWYDAGQEEYIAEGKAKELDYKSPFSGKPLERRKEENYFFRLSAYRDHLLELLEKNEPFAVEPITRRNEIINRIREGLNDVPISRTGAGDWGIKVPGDEKHTIYVWIDALFNYLSTVDTDERRDCWPCDLHVIAKDILWFHAVIWPAMLSALQKRPGYDWVKLPRRLYVHSFWISEGMKMSKSLGNFIDLPTIRRYVERYSLDALRYHLATHGPLGSTDADFTAQHFHDVYHTDLVNTVGNCASRVAAMIGKYFDGKTPSESPNGSRLTVGDHDWPAIADEAVRETERAMEQFALHDAAASALALVRRIDGFINQTEPFKLAKDESRRDEVGAILYQCAEAVRIASLLLWPMLPEKMEQLWIAYGQPTDATNAPLAEQAQWGGLKPGTPLERIALFPRVDEPLEMGVSV